MSRTVRNGDSKAVGTGEILGGDDICFGWGTPPQTPEARRFLRRQAAKARRRNDKAVIEEAKD